MAFLLKRRMDTHANWAAVNPIIPFKQLAFTRDAGGTGIPLIKFGDGVTNWSSLPYINKRNNLEATTSPTTSNNATQFYSVGSMWVNTSSKEMFVLTSFSGSDAVWQPIGELISELRQIQDVPDYPDDGYRYVLTELDGVLSWELPSGGGGGGSQTLAQTLVLGNATNGEDIVFSDGDAADFSAAGIGQDILILPSSSYLQHVAAGIFKLKLTELNIYDSANTVMYQFNSDGTLGVGSINKDGAIIIYDGYSGYGFTISTPDISDDRTLTLPDGDIDFTATALEDGYVLTWDDTLGVWIAKEPISGGLTESDLINTLRSFSKPQWLDVATLTAASNVFTPNLGTAGSFTADIGANSTLANPTIPSGYDTGKVLAWDITFTITGAGGWTLAFGNQYFVDAGVNIALIISENNTTGDKIKLFCQYEEGIISVQPFILTAI